MKIPMIYNWTIALMAFFPGTLKADLLPENPFLNLKSDKTIFYCTAPINDESVEIYKHLPLNKNPDPSPYVISYKPATTQMSRGDLRLNYGKNKISSTSGTPYKTFHEWHSVPNPSHSRKYIANFPEAPNNHIEAKFKKSNNHLKAKFKNSEDELKAIFMESKNYLEAKFKSYKYNSGSQPILQRFLDERPAAKNLMLLNMSVADLKADTARIICDHLANLTHEEKDIFEFAGWMHLIAKMIDIGQVVKITPSTFAADIAFHVGLLSLQQKFALDPERTEIIEALLRILAERRQKFFRNKVFVDNFFKKYDEKLPWMREYYFPQNNLPNTLHYTLSPKIMFDKN
ncbi:expressed protein [Phakopsora pachyrhizi]|uniref:Expressed protein n=1 Tax=Phakopsora pachyrhizi TaxID=170000 RepID=A0AAV0AI98_PHAPC|nr:expressed protein [Phakopsora pachyrhizi]